MNKLTHLSLFSGIGGLDLSAEWAGFKTVGQCEYANFPYKVLCEHWADIPKWRNICEFTAEDFRKRTGLETVDCISGGFPCQPHSLAGKRKASCDERDLWPEMRRVIGEIKPRWVVGENVRGLLSSENGQFFRGILRDFAQMGYDVGWGVISAAEVGAIHRRERIAIIARNTNRDESPTSKKFRRGRKPNLMELLPTITRSDYKGGCLRKNSKKQMSNLKEFVYTFSDEQTHSIYLNPQFCESLMGFPIGWTELKH
ncbi:MAG: DNA cytosine methyltransferase [Acutalibacteraceae bacterium]